MAMLTGWTYRKKITITGSSGAGSGHQVLLKVGESSGSSGADFNVEGHSLLFPTGKNVSGDLRVTGSDGQTFLSFWVEKITGANPNRVAHIWVKVTNNLSSNQDIYIYYNGTTTNVSSGVNTFELFDDFDGTQLDAKWTYVKGSGSCSGGIFLASGFRTAVNSVTNFYKPIRIGTRARNTNTQNYNRFYCGLANVDNSWSTPTNGQWFTCDPYNNYVDLTSVGQTGQSYTVSTGTTWNDYVLSISQNKASLLFNGVQRCLSDAPPGSLSTKLYMSGRIDIATTEYDYIFVAKANDIEPIFNSAGTEATKEDTISNTLMFGLNF